MEETKLQSLKEMTEESFLNRPEQAPEAIDEYLKNIEEKKLNDLKEKLISDSAYYEQFKVAITHTSLMVFIAALKVTQNNVSIDFDQYIREFLFFARQDDKDIYEMRSFYLSHLNADEMGIGSDSDEIIDEDNEDEDNLKEIIRIKGEYNALIENLLSQYKETKIHL